MRPPTFRPRIGLFGTFALASVIPIVLLGLVLEHVLRDEIRDRAVSNARRSAALLEQTLVQPRLARADLKDGLSKRRRRQLDRALAPSIESHEIARIKVWNRRGKVVYATDDVIIGRKYPLSDELEEALNGETASEISELEEAENAADRGFGELLEVYTPLRFGPERRPAGAFELYVPYRPIAAEIDQDTRRLYVVLFGGLVFLYLALLPIVASASRRLQRQAAENKHLALHDSVTGLPNRSLFHDRAGQAFASARRDARRAALMILDLDRFKEVNDTLGHHNGDLLLKEVGARLRELLRESDSVARLGGDEFGLLLPRVTDGDAAMSVAEKVRAALREPFTLEGVTLDVGASIGVALFPEHGGDVETLLQRADVAMYVAKEDHTGYELYSRQRDEYSPSRLALVADLRQAIDRGGLVLYYQPKVEVRSGRVVGVEALVRWRHPERGPIPPAEFVPLAERTGLIRDLSLYVLDSALAQLRVWKSAGLEQSISVNLSARDLLDLGLPDEIDRLLTVHSVEPERLELEITESVILTDPMRARLILNRLSEMGIHLAIDDFGSGYSSLAYLRRLPVGVIKIDRSFVMNMMQDENDAVIVRSTIDLGRNLGLKVVAEGVESEEILMELARLECDLAQGFHLGRPMSADALTAWLRGRASGLSVVPRAASLRQVHPDLPRAEGLS